MGGYFNDRLDGAGDLLHRVQGASVLDIGCNRGMVSLQFANAGASLIHGCDIDETGIRTAAEVFAEWPVTSRFERVDLTHGPAALSAAFGADYLRKYDVVLLLAVQHKLERIMDEQAIHPLIEHLVDRAGRWFVWKGLIRGFPKIMAATEASGLSLVQFSNISQAAKSPIAIFQRIGMFESTPIKPFPSQMMGAAATD